MFWYNHFWTWNDQTALHIKAHVATRCHPFSERELVWTQLNSLSSVLEGWEKLGELQVARHVPTEQSSSQPIHRHNPDVLKFGTLVWAQRSRKARPPLLTSRSSWLLRFHREGKVATSGVVVNGCELWYWFGSVCVLWNRSAPFDHREIKA